MAIVRLARHQAHGQLPEICMKCGEQALTHRAKTFAWYPPWVLVLLVAGVLPFAIVAMVLTKRMRVEVPFCNQHRGHWSSRLWITWLGFLMLMALGVGALVLFNIVPRGRRQGEIEWGGFACLGTLALALVWVIVIAILQFTAIRPKEITDHDITLMNVSPAFSQAVDMHHSRLMDDANDYGRRTHWAGGEDERIRKGD